MSEKEGKEFSRKKSVYKIPHINAFPTKSAKTDLVPETSTQDAFRPAGFISCVACFESVYAQIPGYGQAIYHKPYRSVTCG